MGSKSVTLSDSYIIDKYEIANFRLVYQRAFIKGFRKGFKKGKKCNPKNDKK